MRGHAPPSLKGERRQECIINILLGIISCAPAKNTPILFDGETTD